ncbi:MAG: hypothetical protein JRD89_17185, partial [Deltaproteobacteria bacterium]|nr:hypothetical protein [Deltaproteobacteria bacterium]
TGVKLEGPKVTINTRHIKSAKLRASVSASHTDSVTAVELYDATAGAVRASVSGNAFTDSEADVDVSSLVSGNLHQLRVNVTTASATAGATTDLLYPEGGSNVAKRFSVAYTGIAPAGQEGDILLYTVQAGRKLTLDFLEINWESQIAPSVGAYTGDGGRTRDLLDATLESGERLILHYKNNNPDTPRKASVVVGGVLE